MKPTAGHLSMISNPPKSGRAKARNPHTFIARKRSTSGSSPNWSVTTAGQHFIIAIDSVSVSKTMHQDDLKFRAASAAISMIDGLRIIGVGTGSTVNHFIDLLVDIRAEFDGVVSSSEATSNRLREHGIPLLDLNSTGTLDFYVDGADEINPSLQLIKGGGGALTREKIIANASRRFVCIADSSKSVDILGNFPLPIEVVPMARSFVAREITKLGGQPQWRENFVTDNGNQILDVYNLEILQPVQLETTINNIPGVVTVGLFAARPADTVILACPDEIRTLQAR